MRWSYKNNGALRVQSLLYFLNLVTSSELLLRVYLILALLPGAYARLLVSSPSFINISWHFKCFMAELTGLLVSQVPGNVIREGYALLCPNPMLYFLLHGLMAYIQIGLWQHFFSCCAFVSWRLACPSKTQF